MVLVLLLLGTRLFLIQGLDSRTLAVAAEKQRLRSSVLTAARGDILDRQGRILATDVPTAMVTADPTLVADPQAAAKALAPLVQLPIARIVTLLKTPGRYVVLAKGLEPAVGSDVQSLRLSGIVVTRDQRRIYPGGQLAAGVLGFTGGDTSAGLAGIEYALNKTLMGQDGRSVVETDTSGRQIPGGENRGSPAIPGHNVQLTIDRDIQWIAQSALADQVKKAKARGGSVIVMDIKTGEVLALATAPTFDPNEFAKYPPSVLGNSAASEVYEPGSVDKVITAAAALETGVVTPTTPVVVPSELRRFDRVFHDAEPHGTERLTFAGVLAKSSNIGTILTAEKLGKGVLYDYIRRFGFGSVTGSGLPGESAGLVPRGDSWNSSQSATIPIGQGISATSLQVASVYATVANGGVRVTPHVVAGSFDVTGKLHPNTDITSTRVISSATSATLRTLLEAVTSGEGTAPAAAIDGYRIAGKTGTARRINATGTNYQGYVSSFVGFAPADDPRILVSVVIDDPQGVIFGGLVAAPVFHDVMSFALQTLRIPPTGRRSPVLQLTAP